MIRKNHPIGVFDSGIGGLSVANAIFKLLPNEQLIYFADTARVPYGPRPINEIRAFSKEITSFLLSQSCKMIVVACNTASSAALEQLRQSWPKLPIVGMEPAVKPAAEATRSRKVGVLATAATMKSERYAQLMERYTTGVEVFENPCIGLVSQVEAGRLDTPDTIQLLTTIVDPMLVAGVDTLVLGCTHYPFIQPLLREIVGPEVKIIDPAPAIARQVQRRLAKAALLADANKGSLPIHQLYASGTICELSQLTDIPFQVRSFFPFLDM